MGRPLKYRPIPNGWPMNRTDFKIGTDKKLVVTGEAVYAYPIPKFMYAAGATRFENIDKESPRAVTFAAGLELILFTLNVIYNRINDPVASWKQYPISVYLESLMDKDEPEKVVEHRLIIIEHTNAEISFSAIFAEAWQNVRYPLLPDGTFLDPEKNAKRTMNKNVKTDSSREFNIYELFKYIYDKEALTILCGTLLGVSMTQEVRRRLNTDRNIDDKGNFLHPRKQFHFKHAVDRTSKNVCDRQRDISKYYRKQDSRIQFSFPNQEIVFRIVPQFWNVTRFMTRMFPCLQENEIDVKWAKHMRAMAEKLNQIEEEKRERMYNQKRSAGINDDVGSITSDAKRRRVNIGRNERAAFARGVSSYADSDDEGEHDGQRKGNDDEDEDNEFDFDNLNSRFAAVNQGGIGVGPDTDNVIAMELGPATYGDFDEEGGFALETFGNVREMTIEEEEDNRVLLGMADGYQGRTDVFLDDFIGLNMKMPFCEQASILKKVFADDPKEYMRQLNTLKDVTFDKFKRYCTGGFNVSEAQAKLNKYWDQHNLSDMHFELPETDPTLSVFDNFIIWMTESAGMYEGIATNQALFTFIWLNMNSIFDRSPTVHTNMYIHGDAGVGKTYIADRALRSCLRDTIEDVTSESDLFNTVNATSSDNCCFNEDASIRRFFEKGNGADARKRYEMSAQKTIRKVLELTEDEWGNKLRKTVTYINKAPTTYVDCGNENEGDLGGDLITSKDALVSRYIFVYVRQHNNCTRRIGDPIDPVMSVDEFRRINIKAHCIRGWYAKLADIMEGFNHIDMQAFDNCVPILRNEMKSLGLDYSSNRTEYMMKKYAMGCAILEQYLIHHCTPKGMFFGQPFDIMMMRKWTPFCTVNIVIHTFGRFVDSYIPPALHYTLRFLKNRVISCISDYSKKIKFPGKRVSKPDPTQQVFAGNMALMDNTGASHGKNGGKGGGVNSSFFLSPANFNMGNSMNGYGFGDINGGDRGMVNEEEEEHEGGLGKPEEYDGTFVCFGDETYKSMADMIHVASKSESVIFSPASIEQCLYALKRLSVYSHKYIFLSQSQELPIIKDDAPVGFHEAGAKNSKFGLLINYGLICEGGMYEDIVGHCIKALEYDCTPRQDFLSGVTDEKYPWLYTRVTLNKRPGRKMILRNPKYVTDYSLVSTMGSMNRSILSKDRNFKFNGFDIDMDTHCIMSALRANNPVDEITLEDAMQFHPLKIQQSLIIYYRECIEKKIPSPITNAYYNFVRYPNFARSELDQVKVTADALASGNFDLIDFSAVQYNVWIGNNENPITCEDKERIVSTMHKCYEDFDNLAMGMIAENPGDLIHLDQRNMITCDTNENRQRVDDAEGYCTAVTEAKKRVTANITQGIPGFFNIKNRRVHKERSNQENSEGDSNANRSMPESNQSSEIFHIDDDDDDDDNNKKPPVRKTVSETLKEVLSKRKGNIHDTKSSESNSAKSVVVDISADDDDHMNEDKDREDAMSESVNDNASLPDIDGFI